jgi:hypothetical protein
MRSKTEVTTEINRIVTDRIDAGETVRVEWLTQEILAIKDKIDGEDADFYVACAADFIKYTVKRVIKKYAPQPEAVTDMQVRMDGFDHMLKAYTVQRDGETVLVPVKQLSDTEIEARAQEYEAMAHGCVAHSRELRAFRRGRARAA